MAKLSKEHMLPAMAGHILQHGLAKATLRPLAQAAGTSDRMVLYHFQSKDQVLMEVLTYMAQQLEASLSDNLVQSRGSETDLIADVVQFLLSEPQKKLLRIWFEILAESSAGTEQFQTLAQHVLGLYRNWIVEQLDASPANETLDTTPYPCRQQQADFYLTMMEGLLVIENAHQKEIAENALRYLTRLTQTKTSAH